MTWKAIVEDLVERHGWPVLAERIDVAPLHNAETNPAPHVSPTLPAFARLTPPPCTG